MKSPRFARTIGAFAWLGVALAPPVALGAAGALDPTFGTGGTVVTQFGPQEDRAFAGVLQPDGKIIAAGGSFTSGSPDFGLLRYRPDGTLDPSFGTGGKVLTTFGAPAEIQSIVLQPDGKIVALGYVYTSGQYDIALVRYQANGTPDPTFGLSGVVISTIGPGRGFPREVLLQGDGKIVVAGEDDSAGGAFAAARFETNGNVDTTFGTGGAVRTQVGAFANIADGALLQPDGRLVVAGGADFDFALVRYDTDGTLDGTFGTGGIAIGPSTGTSYVYDVARQADGKLVVCGTTFVGSHYDFTVMRFEANGAIDAGFGTGGVVHTAVGSFDDFPFTVLVQPSGRIIAAGQTSSGFLNSFALVRYTAAGTSDPTFGTGGIVTTAFGTSRSTAWKLLQQPDGRVVAVGQSFGFTGAHGFAVARYFGNVCGDGALETGEQCDDGNTAGGDCCSPACAFEPAGGACADDANACTTDRCDGAGACAHESIACPLCEACDPAIGCQTGPRSGCLAPGALGKTSLRVKNRAVDTSDVEKWQWRSGTVAVGDFGDPLTTDDYALCIFHGPAMTLWRKQVAPAGGTCVSRPCWKTVGAPVFAAEYVDGGGTPDGITAIVLRSNVPGHAQIKLKGKGPSLGLPQLGTLALPVRVQLQRSGGACWEATYTTPRVSTSETFRATGD